MRSLGVSSFKLGFGNYSFSVLFCFSALLISFVPISFYLFCFYCFGSLYLGITSTWKMLFVL